MNAMPDEMKKLREEIEQWLNGGSPQSGYILSRDESRVVIAALRAVEALPEAIRRLSDIKSRLEFDGHFNEVAGCWMCEFVAQARVFLRDCAALASHPAPPAANCWEDVRPT